MTAGALDRGATTRPRGLAAIQAATRSFWRLQIVGWSAYLVVHFFGALTYDEPLTIFWASLTGAVAGFLLTSAMRPILLRVWDRPAAVAAGMALALSFLFAIPFSAVSELSYWLAVGEGWKIDEPVSYLGSAFWCGSILLTWTGVYFGIEYYRQAQEERAAALKAEAVANEARLAALRYQLNPHFLFNTLNGISTLILGGENAAATKMVERLGDLLRESLQDDPREKITLSEELALARLYLDIEQVRFEDRLDVEIEIADEARTALVPRLILQPLIENSVRHAVGPAEDGARIGVEVTVVGDRLRIEVRDDGPGIGGSPRRGHGMGHRNVVQRLTALYGEASRFEVGNGARGGARVVMEMPLEYSS